MAQNRSVGVYVFLKLERNGLYELDSVRYIGSLHFPVGRDITRISDTAMPFSKSGFFALMWPP